MGDPLQPPVESAGLVGKATVAGVKDRATNRVAARVLPDTSVPTLVGVVADSVGLEAQVFTNEAKGYLPLRSHCYGHQVVKHSVGQYVDGMAHAYGMESFWAMLKRGRHGRFQQISPEHLDRYVAEFSLRYNERLLDTVDKTCRMVKRCRRQAAHLQGLDR